MRYSLSILPWATAMTAAAWLLCSCGQEDRSFVQNVGDGETTPTMLTCNVRTFISDSGYTKYLITTPLWAMYEDAKVPFWNFPDGLDLEQYDHDMAVTATMRCDSARYLSQQRLWRLDGNVVMVNTQRDSFLTQQVYWDQGKREVYSDSFIHIVRADRVIEGYGFTSNEQMSAYTVNQPTGIFPVSRRQANDQADSSAQQPKRRPSPRPQQRADTLLMLNADF